jgi:hypothetical protein
MSEKLHDFYDSLRWDGWASETKQLSGDQVIGIYPFRGQKGRRLAIVIAALFQLPSNGRCSSTCNVNCTGIEEQEKE